LTDYSDEATPLPHNFFKKPAIKNSGYQKLEEVEAI
jgi:hypothetical protein